MADVSYGSLPFSEQIAFFRRKLNVNTQSWLDVYAALHDHAFMVAGANRDDLVADFRDAVDAAIANGETLSQFRKRFDAIVAKYGWDYNGSRNWRSRVIYETNLRTSYAAGRWEQLQAVKRGMPFWEYVHADGENHPRPLHLAWNGLVLDADDPWWHTHFPPNGWGCKCSIRARGKRDLIARGKDGPDTAPPVDMQQVTIGQRSPGGPRTVETPAGVDPGFGYAPGKESWERTQALRVFDRQKLDQWIDLPGGSPAQFNRPPIVPIDNVDAPLLPRARNLEDALDNLRTVIGPDDAKVFRDITGTPVLISTAIIDHVGESISTRLDGREQYFGLIPELVTKPYEVWVTAERDPDTGEVQLRRRYIKTVRIDKTRVVGLVVEAVDGVWTTLTFFRGATSALKNLRKAWLLYGR